MQLHVLFPLGIAGKARFAVAGVAGRGGPALGSAADREPLQQLAVEPDVELLRPAHAHDVVLILPAETDFDEVLAVDRKVVANGDAAARSERQIFALPIVLHDVQRNLEGLERRNRGRKTRREPRDLTRHRQVAFQMRRRNREHVGEVVEAAVRGFVARQERLHIEVEREQVADRVVVFGAIETMDRVDPAGIRTRRPRAIDFAFQPARHRAIRGGIGARPSGRRHRAGPKLRDHALPHLGIRCRRRRRSNVSSASPAVRSLWLWQVTQYLSRTARDACAPTPACCSGARGRAEAVLEPAEGGRACSLDVCTMENAAAIQPPMTNAKTDARASPGTCIGFPAIVPQIMRSGMTNVCLANSDHRVSLL